MSSMNVLNIESVQSTDISVVSAESALGPWNGSSGKFSDLINQHKKESSGNSEPKSGNGADKVVTIVAESDIKETNIENQPPQSSAEVLSKGPDEQSDNFTTEQNSENLPNETIVNQQITPINDDAEHLKLLAMIATSNTLSVDHKNLKENGLPATEVRKLAELLGTMKNLTEAEYSEFKAKFESLAGKETAALALQKYKFKTPDIVINPIQEKKDSSLFDSESVEQLDSKGAQSGIKLDEKISAAISDKVAIKVNATETVEANNKVGLRGQFGDVVAQSKSVSVIFPQSETLNSGNNTNDNKDTKTVNETVIKTQFSDVAEHEKVVAVTANKQDVTSSKNVDSATDKIESKLKSAQFANQGVSLNETKNQSTDSFIAAATAKGVEATKEVNVSLQNNANKESSVNLDRISGSRSFNQSNGESKEQSGQGKANSEANTFNLKADAIKSAAGDADKTQPELSVKHRIEQESNADIKHALSMLTPKETSALKPIEHSSHNIHSANFVQAEQQAAAHIIEKSASDAVDAMTQKKTLNLHNETIAIHRKDFSVAVKDKVMVMISQKLQQIEIRLDPPELGSMHVKVNLQNEQAVVSFIVQNQQAKEALEQSMGKLRDMLSESGVDVGDANVEQQQQQASSEDASTERNQHAEHENVTDIDDQQSFVDNANLYKASATSIDYYA
ncbi:flagellar hook-length control protein FliK [Thalassotalea piscium]|uniref:Flagellar hook-length control protein FliK n=1 Tax=Thalassotalea piscium TaxID=1230533 RepID=A0A7X0NK01_9GAMM|nr:flagellar hook-length control protein FliK [Thalassotalea piscium]MBB6544872.1 flagellar hook-length control protein FliK [Thalassotalea piscium]